MERRLGIENGKDFPKELRKPRSLTSDARAEASSVYNNDTLHYSSDYAVDSDVSTSCVSGDSLARITVNLDGERTFNRIFVIAGENSIRDFDIEVENAGAWTTVYRSGLLPVSYQNSFMGYGVIDFALPETLTTDKFRMNIRQSNGKPSIYSIRLK